MPESDDGLEFAAGFRADGVTWPGAGALVATGLVAVGEGSGGHGTGWLAARRVLRALAYGSSGVALFGAAAHAIPEPRYFAAWCEPEPVDLTSDLVATFSTLERALTLPRDGSAPLSLAVSCSAATIAKTTLRGAHAGTCRVAVLRAGSSELHDLVRPHVREIGGVQVVVNALGLSRQTSVVDRFEITLSPGDVVLFASRPLGVVDRAIAHTIHQSASIPIAEVARAIERIVETPELAFVVVRAT